MKSNDQADRLVMVSDMRHDVGLRSIGRQYPRTLSALVFGATAVMVTHYAWIPDARTDGIAPALTAAAGVLHALAAALTGRRLLDERQTRSVGEAGRLGALSSLLALGFFAPLFSIFLFASGARPSGWMTYLLMPVFVAIFAFLAIGWALILVSTVIACAIYGIMSK